MHPHTGRQNRRIGVVCNQPSPESATSITATSVVLLVVRKPGRAAGAVVWLVDWIWLPALIPDPRIGLFLIQPHVARHLPESSVVEGDALEALSTRQRPALFT